ncbi:MAG: ribosome silencing factor [Porticoccaceae bacterium]|jgi:ribosome-associated protein|nr:ribosome silencing factor [Porticoccaceae bacterium]|tara:strand:+ start:1059 stop:1445 length:387 start_codon:yes stop_codon:yes gene_type:complete
MKKNLHEIVINALEDVKAQDIVSIDVMELTGVMDTMVVASGNSSRQVKSLANNVIVDGKKAGFSLLGVEGDDIGEWVLVDFGAVIVHIMLPATRVFYDLEKLWSLRPDDRPINADQETLMNSTAGLDQ